MNSRSPTIARMLDANARFRLAIEPARLPVARTPGELMVITCMDPRVNIASIGIPAFSSDGACDSGVRIVRTIGARHEPRSLLIGTHLAGIREIVILMHTDCGCCLAGQKIDAIIKSINANASAEGVRALRELVGGPFGDRLGDYLQVFADPRAAVREEVARVRIAPGAPRDLMVHGLVYSLETAEVEVIVDGGAQ